MPARDTVTPWNQVRKCRNTAIAGVLDPRCLGHAQLGQCLIGRFVENIEKSELLHNDTSLTARIKSAHIKAGVSLHVQSEYSLILFAAIAKVHGPTDAGRDEGQIPAFRGS